ncbi:Translation elongation factor P Lys34:lysine transferase [Thioalkalivibrio nitratireducens DSM 14787]|uniref:Translation elongation factor P Lys34:lysine transferase n=1 Tax=Thioalkalivibrio nitratireducens (strain DSM 14787 / UNIQEM 213 / ALEN2) TaxID=1255043 RepID=L0E0K9_THIND|nr:Translation elongation factor P Lys34:lysine transferase [Thioalkalivibrio nitratireducens DSM 14787]
MNAAIRRFFARRGVLEVETPVLSGGAPLDPGVESWCASAPGGASGYLQTSPEYPMKRLLADGSGDIYQIARVFRGEERGRRHNPEFTLLEWYRQGYDDGRLMDEVLDLVQAVAAEDRAWARPVGTATRVAYAELFRGELGLDPLTCSAVQCARAAHEAGLELTGNLDRDGWLDALMALVLAPRFPRDRLTFIVDYPESQAILARSNPRAVGYASRFELYWGDLELANGFHELTDPAVFLKRREADRARRERQEQPIPEADEYFAQAMQSGLPDCSGVALGIDRLLMRLLDVDDITGVIDFPWGRA